MGLNPMWGLLLLLCVSLMLGQVKTGSDDLDEMLKSTGNNGTSEHPIIPTVHSTTLSADGPSSSNNATSDLNGTIHDGAITHDINTTSNNAVAHIYTSTTVETTSGPNSTTTPDNTTAGEILATPDNNTSGEILTTHDNTTSEGTLTTHDNTTSEGNLTTHDNNTVGETTGMPVLHTDISTPLPVATTRTPSSNITNSTPSMAMSTDKKVTRITTPISTSITDADNTTKTSLVHIQTDERPNEPVVHRKSGKSLALGITIPLLIVVVVIGALWIRRRLRKVPKSGTGYLTLEEEAHSFGSLQSPTYDIDL